MRSCNALQITLTDESGTAARLPSYVRRQQPVLASRRAGRATRPCRSGGRQRWSFAAATGPGAHRQHQRQGAGQVRRGLVEVSPRIGDERGDGVVDDATANDQRMPTPGARSTLCAIEDEQAGPCWDVGACETAKVSGATRTTVSASTARGTATVPALVVRGRRTESATGAARHPGRQPERRRAG